MTWRGWIARTHSTPSSSSAVWFGGVCESSSPLAGDMDGPAWELSKENVLPRKRGRDTADLARVFGATVGERGIGKVTAAEVRARANPRARRTAIFLLR